MSKPARGGRSQLRRPLSPRTPHRATQSGNILYRLSTLPVITNTTYSLALSITNLKISQKEILAFNLFSVAQLKSLTLVHILSAWPSRGSLRGTFGLRNYEMVPLRVYLFSKIQIPTPFKAKNLLNESLFLRKDL